MSNGKLEITVPTGSIGDRNNFGGKNCTNESIANGVCSYCGRHTSLRQVGSGHSSDMFGWMVSVRCDACNSTMTLSYDSEEDQVSQYPSPKVESVGDLPPPIEDYYDEACRCISADAPNGAATLFRKTIHSVAMHYDLVEVNDSETIFGMIEMLDEQGHINQKLRDALLAVKDIGNDGAHINENEPDVEQALAIKRLIDALLESTVLTDQRIQYARDHHPNPHSDSGNGEAGE